MLGARTSVMTSAGKTKEIEIEVGLHQGAVAGIRRKGLSDGLTLMRWRNAIFRVAGATN